MTDRSAEQRARECLAAVTEQMATAGKYVARDILAGNLSPDNKRAIAAMLAFEAAAVERAAKVAECAFDDRPRSRVGHHSQMDHDDGYLDGTRAAAAAIRAQSATHPRKDDDAE